MKPREFHLPTSWRVRSTAARAYDSLSKPREFVRWWPEVYLDVREVKPGDANGVGRIMELHTKGWLPYRSTTTGPCSVTKPWMVVLAPLLRPVFAANHRWAMARGLEGLERELARDAPAAGGP